MRIAIASDHAATGLQGRSRPWLGELGHDVADLGPQAKKASTIPTTATSWPAPWPPAKPSAASLCGSGIGISIAVNRNPAVRCALVGEPLSAKLA
jgi:ribose 5-phosphate isomerase B